MSIEADSGIFNVLVCSCCGAELSLSENKKSLICGGVKRHCFDISSSGHVNFDSRHSGGGDSKEAVLSRKRFLDKDYYKPVSDAVNEIFRDYLSPNSFVIDAGCGEGYYTCRAATTGVCVLGFDLSKEAASKRAKREGTANAFFGVASVFSLPVADTSVDAVINIFAPCVESEYCRVLKSDGILAVAYAGREHLIGLKRCLYDNVYENEARSDMPCHMELIEERQVVYDISLRSSEDINDLFLMTPYYWRTSIEDKKKLEDVEALDTRVDIKIATYKKKTVEERR